MTRPQHLLRLSKYLPAFDLTSLTKKKEKKASWEGVVFLASR